MPRMPQHVKEEMAFFLNEHGRITYNAQCKKCESGCKPSFRVKWIYCPKDLKQKAEQLEEKKALARGRKGEEWQTKECSAKRSRTRTASSR